MLTISEIKPKTKKESPILNVSSADQFKKLTEEARLSVVHFWATWANQCEPMDDAIKVMAEEEQELSEVRFLRVEAEEKASIALDFQVAAVPTVLFFRAGQLVQRIEGAKPADVTQAVRKLASQKISTSRAASPRTDSISQVTSVKKKESLESRLKALLNSSKCMLFMKGDPSTPKCGFSRQTVELLQSLNAEFGSFDILTDEEIRQGLKTYSDWPTYPQLYIDGQLIGGLDILKEMHASGDLEPILPKKLDLTSRLKKLVRRHKVMVFMKGTPDVPKCGFSRQLMEILLPLNVEFDTFNILENDEIRQGLKQMSNWPTYPQVYVDGEMLGGLDIVKDLRESGELETALRGKKQNTLKR